MQGVAGDVIIDTPADAAGQPTPTESAMPDLKQREALGGDDDAPASEMDDSGVNASNSIRKGNHVDATAEESKLPPIAGAT